MADAVSGEIRDDAPAPDDVTEIPGEAVPPRPVSYAPDPAGTRPKVSSESLAAVPPPPRIRTTDPVSGALGQTFRGPAGDGAPARAPGVLPGEVALAGAGVGVGVTAEGPVESPHAPRFQFILGALLALGLSAIAITAYTLGSARNPLPTDWSTWHPAASGIAGAAEIANHVAAEYRQPGTGQLLAVKGGPLALAGVPVTIALKTGTPATGGVNVLTGNAVLYKMCGLGPSCSITGKASAARLMLVRREALELALYTFQYVGGVDQVVVFLPPVIRTPVAGQKTKAKATADTTDAVFFRSGDLSGELSHPLDSTLTQQTPSLATVAGAPDTALVDQLTSPSFYKFSFVQTAQDASLFLVLEPLALGS
ncbi:MAG: hypothetical protein QOF77_1987 [Solirubrobacteraceae bacterium]|jgi:hypothetical protein|nr:hypothetical protein [Solirubrobacteraceae bacterium]